MNNNVKEEEQKNPAITRRKLLGSMGLAAGASMIGMKPSTAVVNRKLPANSYS